MSSDELAERARRYVDEAIEEEKRLGSSGRIPKAIYERATRETVVAFERLSKVVAHSNLQDDQACG